MGDHVAFASVFVCDVTASLKFWYFYALHFRVVILVVETMAVECELFHLEVVESANCV